MKITKTLHTTTLLATAATVFLCAYGAQAGELSGTLFYPQRAGTAVSAPQTDKARTEPAKLMPKTMPAAALPAAGQPQILKTPAPQAKAAPSKNIESRFQALSTLETSPKTAPISGLVIPPLTGSLPEPHLMALPQMPASAAAQPSLQANADAEVKTNSAAAAGTPETYGIFDYLSEVAAEKSPDKTPIAVAQPVNVSPETATDASPKIAPELAAVPPQKEEELIAPASVVPEADMLKAASLKAPISIASDEASPASKTPVSGNLITEIKPVSAQLALQPLHTSADVAEPTVKGKGYLDAETQRILSRIPRGLDGPPRQSNQKASVDRYDPEIEGLLSDKGDEAETDDVSRSEALGVSIEVRRPKLDVNLALQDAYDALLDGKPHEAIAIYKDILRQSSRQQDALFGIATTFHRLGEPEKARPFYVRLLQINPEHRDGLSNFLALVAQDAPDEAVQQLEKLAKNNQDFAPLAAQLGALYDSLGDKERAINALIHAVQVSPDNPVYQYNLAVLYDKYGRIADATQLYNRLLAQSRSGVELPADPNDLQERVIYINNPDNHKDES